MDVVISPEQLNECRGAFPPSIVIEVRGHGLVIYDALNLWRRSRADEPHSRPPSMPAGTGGWA